MSMSWPTPSLPPSALLPFAAICDLPRRAQARPALASWRSGGIVNSWASKRAVSTLRPPCRPDLTDIVAAWAAGARFFDILKMNAEKRVFEVGALDGIRAGLVGCNLAGCMRVAWHDQDERGAAGVLRWALWVA